MTNYQEIFGAIEQSLVRHSSLPEDKIQQELAAFKYTGNETLTDEDYFRRLVTAVFYSGIRAETVTERLDTIFAYFPNWETAVGYGEEDIRRMLQDPHMLRSQRKIRGCVANSLIFRESVARFGSFGAYVESFQPWDSFENLMLLKEELEYRLSGIGPVTIYHFLTEIGLPVLKPDRVICRIFKRLGLIEDEQQLLKAVIQGRKFSKATGHPIRYIDVVFVTYGQAQTKQWGIERGVCLSRNPACHTCLATQYCQYFRARTKA